MNKRAFDNEDELVRLYLSGVSRNALCKQFSCSDTSVMRCLLEHGVALRTHAMQSAIRSRVDPKRLREHVETRAIAGEGGCWNFTGKLYKGYGRMVVNGKSWYAHRLAYTAFRGPIPPLMAVGQRCGNHRCVNPAHLILLTGKQCIARAVKGRSRASGLKQSLRMRGERNGAAKLTWEAVRLIREAASRGADVWALAHEYSVSTDTIVKVIRNQSWKVGIAALMPVGR